MDHKEDFSRYADMLDLPHHISETRAQMSLHDRAAQFAPFAALTGYEDAIEEMGRLTDLQTELDENRKENLNGQIRLLLDIISAQPEVEITWFAEDERKQGGKYLTSHGRLLKHDAISNTLTVSGIGEIKIENIYQIESPLLEND